MKGWEDYRGASLWVFERDKSELEGVKELESSRLSVSYLLQ